jgi:protocatechuate 3,4-dioxygenase beta subunit
MRRTVMVTAAAAAAVVLGGSYAVLAARDSGQPTAASPRPADTTVNRSCTVTPGEPAQGTTTVAAGTPSRTRLGPGMELQPTAEAIAAGRHGQRLLVSGNVYAADCRTPLAGASLHVWQTNADGEYGPGHGTEDLRCCYLQGTLRTDARGRYEFQTVMPGHYRGERTPPPAHIHFEVGHPDARGLMTELLFSGDPSLDPSRDAAPVAQLTRVAGADPPLLHARFDIVLPRK